MLKRPAVLVLLAVLPACGGGGASAPTSPTPAPTAARSVLTIGVSGAVFRVLGRDSYQDGRERICGDASAVWTVTESAGLPARLAQSDVYIQEADGDVQGRRATPGSGESVVAGRPLTFIATRTNVCGWNTGDLPFVMKVVLDLQDDRGNAHKLTGEVAFPEGR